MSSLPSFIYILVPLPACVLLSLWVYVRGGVISSTHGVALIRVCLSPSPALCCLLELCRSIQVRSKDDKIDALNRERKRLWQLRRRNPHVRCAHGFATVVQMGLLLANRAALPAAPLR